MLAAAPGVLNRRGLMSRMRGPLLAALAALLLAVSCGHGAPSPEASPTGDPGLWRTAREEPYPFTTPIPPRSATPVDGLYARDFSEGSEPIPCRRCAPYRLDRGAATLELREGRFRVVQEENLFSTEGHFVVDGDRLILFNDPVCPETRGVYAWTLEGSSLSLRVVDDLCPFDLLRARYLGAAPWLG